MYVPQKIEWVRSVNCLFSPLISITGVVNGSAGEKEKKNFRIFIEKNVAYWRNMVYNLLDFEKL